MPIFTLSRTMNKKKEKTIQRILFFLALIGTGTMLFIGGMKIGYSAKKCKRGITFVLKTECIPQEFCEKMIDKWCSYKQREAQKEGERGYYGMDCLDWHLEQQFKQYWEKQNE